MNCGALTRGCIRQKYLNVQAQNTYNSFYIHPDNLISAMNNEKWRKTDLVEFTMKFNGEAVESNEMDADELATSLLGISAVLEDANTVLNGQYSKIFVKVHSSFKPGSFIVDITSFFVSDGITALINITSLVGLTGGTGTLIWLFKQTKGNKILTKKRIQGDNYEITVENCNNPIIINGNVVTLYENTSIRKGLTNLTYPLINEGISDITFLKNGEVREKLMRHEKEYFSLLDNEPIDKKEDIDYFLITQSNFEGKQTGWRLSFGSTLAAKKPDDFPVKVLDFDFLQGVKEQKIIISNEGTVIKAKYRKTTQKFERLSVSWEILNVLNIDHITNKNTDKIKRFF